MRGHKPYWDGYGLGEDDKTWDFEESKLTILGQVIEP